MRIVIPLSQPIRSAITVAGIVGVSRSSSRIFTSTASTTEPFAGRRYFGSRSLARVQFTVFFEMPRCRAIARIGICAEIRCNWRISAQSSTRIPLPPTGSVGGTRSRNASLDADASQRWKVGSALQESQHAARRTSAGGKAGEADLWWYAALLHLEWAKSFWKGCIGHTLPQ
ncbi:hypothetical protein [Streptomyces yunnanensis]|uniref:hypothetical protein n=1 Tax=Streptomyces yunnanensis TaxID=156453 RepID=UPI00256FDD0A|nr:hypothetical protein [Streptomyces yunnanensis]